MVFQISFALVICLIDDSSLKNIHYSIIGFLVTSLISNISITNNNFFYSLVISLFIAIALVLPGISITNILIAMNTYELTLDAISKLDFRFLIFNFWLVPIWLVFIAKLINNSYKKYPKQTNGFVLGTVFASALEAIPTFSGENLMLGLFTMLFGLFLFLFIYGYCKRANVI
jgi:putative membrane protein